MHTPLTRSGLVAIGIKNDRADWYGQLGDALTKQKPVQEKNWLLPQSFPALDELRPSEARPD